MVGLRIFNFVKYTFIVDILHLFVKKYKTYHKHSCRCYTSYEVLSAEWQCYLRQYLRCCCHAIIMQPAGLAANEDYESCRLDSTVR